MKPASFEYKSARTPTEAAEILATHDGEAKLLAGGQSLTPMLNLRLARPKVLVDIKRMDGLRELAGDDAVMSIGAGWRHAEIEDGAFEDPTQGFLRHVARGIAYRAVRNRGTIGGSLAHADPAADWVSSMVALGATLVCQGPEGMKRRISAESFLEGAFQTALGQNDVLIAIEIPRLSSEGRWGYYKVCRKSGEFAHAIGVVVCDRKKGLVRVVVGATDGSPCLLPQAANALAEDHPLSRDCDLYDEISSVLPGRDEAAKRLHAIAVRRAIDAMTAVTE